MGVKLGYLRDDVLHLDPEGLSINYVTPEGGGVGMCDKLLFFHLFFHLKVLLGRWVENAPRMCYVIWMAPMYTILNHILVLKKKKTSV